MADNFGMPHMRSSMTTLCCCSAFWLCAPGELSAQFSAAETKPVFSQTSDIFGIEVFRFPPGVQSRTAISTQKLMTLGCRYTVPKQQYGRILALYQAAVRASVPAGPPAVASDMRLAIFIHYSDGHAVSLVAENDLVNRISRQGAVNDEPRKFPQSVIKDIDSYITTDGAHLQKMSTTCLNDLR